MSETSEPREKLGEKEKLILALDSIIGPDFTLYDTKQSGSILPPDFPPPVLPSPSSVDIVENATSGVIKGPPAGQSPKYSYSLPTIVKHSGVESAGRALICSAYGDTAWSLTLRCDEPNDRQKHESHDTSLDAALRKYIDRECPKEEARPRGKVRLSDVLGYCPQGNPNYSQVVIDEPKDSQSKAKPQKDIFLNDIQKLCGRFKELLFPLSDSASHASGLVVITGTTDSSKSLVTRGLIFLFLEEAARRAHQKAQRKPHLVTFEDPIEQYYVKSPKTKTTPASLTDLCDILDALYIDYTPREKDRDAGRLRDVTRDALRQTPAVLFVGETREREDWRDLLDFAASGHLVITTSHASSVVEAMTGIFRATDTKTPAQRSEIARRVLGIINIRSFHPQARTRDIADNSQLSAAASKHQHRLRALLPALWKSTSQARNNLVADGLASLLPSLGNEPEIGYYSRTHFANELTKPSCLTNDLKTHDESDLFIADIKRQAREWDIEGV